MTLPPETHELTVRRTVRRFLLFRPTSPPTDPMPLVVDLHGSGSSPAQHARISRSPELVTYGALVALPAAAVSFSFPPARPAGFAWTIPGVPLPGESTPAPGPDDIAFLTALIRELRHRPDVDASRVHLLGYSGGARLACRIAASTPELLTSVAVVAGVRAPTPDAHAAVRMLAVHGRADPINTFSGGQGSRWLESVTDAVAGWAGLYGGTLAMAAPEPDGGTIEWLSRISDGTAYVRLVVLPDGGHAWPGCIDGEHLRWFGPASTFDATAAAWTFFKEACRAGP